MKSRQLFNCNADKEIAAVPLIQNAANEFKKCCLAVFLVAWVAWVARSLVSLVWVVNCGPAAWMDESTRNFLNSRLLAFFSASAATSATSAAAVLLLPLQVFYSLRFFN